MEVDFDTAVRTLVCVAMGQAPDKRVAAGLIVAVLARKFSRFPESHISRMVTKAILEEGGTTDPTVPIRPAVPLRTSA